jgi:hypothetical protein
MTFERKIADAFGLDDESWMRHAHPWSVWGRVTILPLLIAAIWSRVWLGWWSLVPIALAIAWTWVQPHVLEPPASTDNWASKSVLGERVWTRRDEVTVPDRHAFVPHLLNGINGAASLVLAWGLWQLELWPIACGAIVTYLAKFWYLDRMVWLFEDVKTEHDAYREWLY